MIANGRSGETEDVKGETFTVEVIKCKEESKHHRVTLREPFIYASNRIDVGRQSFQFIYPGSLQLSTRGSLRRGNCQARRLAHQTDVTFSPPQTTKIPSSRRKQTAYKQMILIDVFFDTVAEASNKYFITSAKDRKASRLQHRLENKKRTLFFWSAIARADWMWLYCKVQFNYRTSVFVL